MRPTSRRAARLSGLPHPRLAGLAALGAAVGLVGVGLFVLGPVAGTGPLGRGLALVGALASLLGASGYVAFTLFERAER